MAKLCFLLLIIFIIGISDSQYWGRRNRGRGHSSYNLQWTQWSSCIGSCYRSYRSRQICRYGRRCQTQRERCTSQSCRTMFEGTTQWGQWSRCSRTCGGGQSIRRRRTYDSRYSSYQRRHYRRPITEDRRSCNNNPCPRNGGFSVWSHWTTCSKTCGGGRQVRSRTCTNPAPAYGGSSCRGNSITTRTCNNRQCPVNGGFSNWNAWSRCSITCGNGIITRSRTCTNPRPANGGSICPGNFVEEMNCNPLPCPVDGGFSNWNTWSSCSVSCGNGIKSRSRTCNNPSPINGGRNCSGDFVEELNCNPRPCPVDGGFSNWNTWSSCSVSCGSGIKSRRRTCTTPSPANGGRDCSGDFVEELNCNPLPCPVDGGFSMWNTWSSCSVSCGSGIKSRSRTCTTPSPANGGRNCSGDFIEEMNCSPLPCPVDGGFSNWNTWSSCSVSCGNGIKSRSRTCTNPSPAYAGRNCSGDFVEELICNPLPCPVDGGFTNWNTWSSCSVSCGNGIQSRSRTCTNPSPANGGRNCSGDFVEELNCNPLPCPVDGGFSNWNTWSSCSVSCGNGTKSRSRACTNPNPTYGGRNCSGDFVEELICNPLPCPVDGGFTTWNTWSSCSVSCGNGIKSRSRTCTNPSPAYGGRICSGHFVEELNCNPLPCPVDGGFSNWNEWSSCSVSCGNGTMSRSRTCTNPSPANGGRNCSSDFVDEMNCNSPPCSVCTAGQFECADKTCISIVLKCDGFPDCQDRSDEVADLCDLNDLCPEGQTMCANGQCVAQSYLCS